MNLPLHSPMSLRPYARGGRHAVALPQVGLSRVALGAALRLPHWPDMPCEFCWPRLITAQLYVHGKASCTCCAANPNRVARLPRFGRGELH